MNVVCELKSGALRCDVVPAVGGAISSLWFHDTPVLRASHGQALGSPREAACFALIPYSNRVGNGHLDWQNARHLLRSTPGDFPHAIHGVGWQNPWHVTHKDSCTLEMEYRHVGDDSWPFPFVGRQRLQLTERSLLLELTYLNTHPTSVPVGLGWHPYFVKRAHSRISFQAQGRWDNSPDKLPTVRAPCDGIHASTAGMAVDNCFDGWTGTASIEDEFIQTTVRACTSYLVAYTRVDTDFFALEPVTHANNAIQLSSMLQRDVETLGLRVLPPGQTQTFQATLEINRKS